MRKKFSLLVMGLVLVLFSYSFAQIPIQQSPRAGVDYVADQLIIKFKSQIEEGQKKAVTNSLNSVTLKKFSIIGAELVQISGITVEDAINLLKDDPHIEYAEPNYIGHVAVTPNDPYFNSLWGMRNTGQDWGTPDADIDAEKAWDISTGDSVIVGVMDSGVDTSHIDLMGNIWTNPGEIPNNGIDDDGNGCVDDVHGWDFVNNNNDPNDIDGHGSHVSGTIAAKGNNGIGVVGVCWSAKIMALKICESGSCYYSSAISALEYATEMGAKLTSNSWGGTTYSTALKNAIDSTGAHGMLCIAAAHNQGRNNDVTPIYPASYNLNNIIAVAATDHNDSLANEATWGSNWGLTSVDLAAPGVNILSTVPPVVYGSDYAYFSGTSMATPHVSGTAALIWSKYPTLTHLQVKERIMNSVDPLPSLAGKCVTGGRLNAYRAIAEPDSIPPSPVTDLAVIQTGGEKITLSWTATGDDSSTGRAYYYDVRYSFSSIDSSNFNLATQVIGEPEPKSAGSPETLLVTGLNFNTPYYFAVKAFDEWNHPSGVSNSPLGITLGPPDIAFTPGSLIDSLFPNDTSTKILTVNNTGLSDLSMKIFIDKTPSLFTLSRRRIPELKIDPSRIRTDFSGSSGSISGDRPVARTVKPEDVVKIYISTKSAPSNATSNIAVLGADAFVDEFSLNNNVAQYLVSSGRFASVTTLDGCYFTPTLSELQMFDGVLVFGWYNWDNPTAIGNVLADFVDNGGRLMVAVAANATGGDWQIKGRFNTQNYWLISPNGGDFAGPYLMGTVHHPEHPIMSGVSSVVSGCKFSSSATVSPGTVRLADFTDGTPLLVIKEQIGNRRVDISFPVITKRVNPQLALIQLQMQSY